MRRDAEKALTLMCLLYWIPQGTCHSPPERPQITKCRSPEKETFTCWWEPGATGGLPTTYHLLYSKENSVDVFECPDYHQAGNNSCYFDKTYTSIWITYNITVVASNPMGKAYSKSLEVDVMDVVQPNPPENVTLTLLKDGSGVLAQWRPPHNTDTGSGWVTANYEIRVTKSSMTSQDEDNGTWETFSAGKGTDYCIYSPQPSEVYLLQVRCKLDQGRWSDWSATASVQIPNKESDSQDTPMMVMATVTVLFLLTTALFAVKRKQVKDCILPPVPEPKILGLDFRQMERSEAFSVMIHELFPQSPDHKIHCLVLVDDEDTQDNAQNLQEHGSALEKDLQDDKPACENDSTATLLCSTPIDPCVLSSEHLRVSADPLKPPSSSRNTELSGYVEVGEQREQAWVDYSLVSDVINDTVVVLKDNIPATRPTNVKDGLSEVESCRATEAQGYLESLTTFLGDSDPSV